jgi:hypothetical protein
MDAKKSKTTTPTFHINLKLEFTYMHATSRGFYYYKAIKGTCPFITGCPFGLCLG